MAANDSNPALREARKTASEKAEDIAYTINHSLYCTLTDFLNPPINTATDGWLRWLIPGCGHDHSADHAHGEDHHEHGAACDHTHHHEHKAGTWWERVKQSTRRAFSKERFIEYAKGEFIGDFGAVPLTIGVQRFFPGVMAALRKVTEPVISPLFRRGIMRDSKRWAKENSIDQHSDAFKAHATAVYEYEMSHFPQAVVWTGFSLPLNVSYQMVADKSHDFTHLPFFKKLALKSGSVMAGVLVTAGVVVVARALAPRKTHAFDQWTSRNVILPSTKAVGKIFGIKQEDVDRMAEKEKALKEGSWAEQIRGSEASTGQVLR